MTTPSYQKGAKAKATLTGVKIRGLNSLTIPQPVRDTFVVEEFEEIDSEETSDLKWERGKMAGNAVKGDVTGQAKLRSRLFSDEAFTDLFLYENETDFWAADVAGNPLSCFKVVGIPAKEINKNGLIPFSCDILVKGQLACFTAHLTAKTIAFVRGSGAHDTITDSGSGFSTAGFKPGQTIIVEGTTNNDGQYTIESVAAGVITLNAEGVLTAETAGDSFTLHGGSVTE
ncbi:hypothetical protein GO013_15555 [Pseudodesulfovibrio sp. JC047]|uniref:hypothetical protein n=1 Tax=Pseudodesulfovibrio sp. JC047 TaxID=2683199 RepID=UPI0013D5256A|nr:hypothetical protein [Pseudodesulfovibrio sp. JC047]NDV20826.1 hypothetical protein [Pseudodesulfovibrio sp. JC047]